MWELKNEVISFTLWVASIFLKWSLKLQFGMICMWLVKGKIYSTLLVLYSLLSLIDMDDSVFILLSKINMMHLSAFNYLCRFMNVCMWVCLSIHICTNIFMLVYTSHVRISFASNVYYCILLSVSSFNKIYELQNVGINTTAY